MALAKVSHPIPFRTRSLNPLAPMVLCLKTRESRSPPVLPFTYFPFYSIYSFYSFHIAPIQVPFFCVQKSLHPLTGCRSWVVLYNLCTAWTRKYCKKKKRELKSPQNNFFERILAHVYVFQPLFTQHFVTLRQKTTNHLYIVIFGLAPDIQVEQICYLV